MKKEKLILQKNINDVDFPSNIKEKLTNLNINTIKELWNITRKELKEKQFSDNEINQIQIQLQLNGIDLNKKIY